MHYLDISRAEAWALTALLLLAVFGFIAMS